MDPHMVPYTKARHPTMPTMTWMLRRSRARPKSRAGPRSSTSCSITVGVDYASASVSMNETESRHALNWYIVLTDCMWKIWEENR